MIYVTMRDGRTLRYNTCTSYTTEEQWLKLESPGNCHICRITIADVERIEFTKPCAITKNGKQVKVNY